MPRSIRGNKKVKITYGADMNKMEGSSLGEYASNGSRLETG